MLFITRLHDFKMGFSLSIIHLNKFTYKTVII